MRVRRMRVAAACIMVAALTACDTEEPREIVVFAASSLTEAFTGLAHEFEATNPGVTVTLSYAGSSQLRTQITAGAAADVFASASESDLTTLVDTGMLRGEPRRFASNELVLAVPIDNPAEIVTLADLDRDRVRIVVAAAEVPAGAYARQALERYAAAIGDVDFADRVLERITSNETNVRGVLSKLTLGEADAGFVYRTDARVASDEILIVELPDSARVHAHYPLATLTAGKAPLIADQFVQFVLNSVGQSILAAHGFAPPA